MKQGRIAGIVMVISACIALGWVLFAQAAPQAAAPAQSASHATPFDHSKTGFVLKDVHTTLKCEQCHVDGIFKNTPKECAGCHTTGTRVSATPKPINHVPTAAACDTCHISAANFLVKSYKHVGIIGDCATCHNGQSLGVVSKPANHFPTLLPCESCHTNTSTFLSWRMDHTGLTTGCAQCHGGQYVGVVGQPAMHIPTSGKDCGVCHTNTNTFLGATYDHAGVTANSCATCHGGAYPGVKTQPATHIPTPAGTFCDTCHTQANTNGYTSFLGAIFHSSYTVAAGSCYNCHSGAYVASSAQPKPATHIPTSPSNQSCDVCHTNGIYTAFSGGNYHQIAANNPPTGACSVCHSGAYAGWTSSNSLSPQPKIPAHIPTTSDCGTCHTATNTSTYTTFLGAGFHGVASNNVGIAGTCGKSSCHDGSGTGGALGHPNTTVHNGIGINCDSCHTQQLTANYTTFLGASFNHAGVTGGTAGKCATCHDNVTAVGKPSGHIPVNLSCDLCHTVPGYPITTTFAGATFHTSAASSTATGICQTCHTGTYTAYTSANGLVPQAQSVPHIPASGSCDTCHTAAVTHYNSATGFLGATYNHAGVAAGGCATCHSGAYPGVDSQNMCYGTGGTGAGCPTVGAFSHQATSAPCDQCHTVGASLSYTTWANAGYTHTAADAGKCATSSCHGAGGAGKGISSNHFPTTISCDSGGCHNNPGVSFAGGQLVHSVVTSMRCDSCHNGSYNAFGATGAIPKVTNHIPTTITGSLDCNTCHTGTTPQTAATATGGTAMWGVGAQPGERMNHNGTTGSGAGGIYCVTCHLTGNPYLVPNVTDRPTYSHNGASVSKDCSRSSCHKPLGSKGVLYQTWN